VTDVLRLFEDKQWSGRRPGRCGARKYVFFFRRQEEYGNGETQKHVDRLMPNRVKKRRKVTTEGGVSVLCLAPQIVVLGQFGAGLLIGDGELRVSQMSIKLWTSVLRRLKILPPTPVTMPNVMKNDSILLCLRIFVGRKFWIQYVKSSPKYSRSRVFLEGKIVSSPFTASYTHFNKWTNAFNPAWIALFGLKSWTTNLFFLDSEQKHDNFATLLALSLILHRHKLNRASNDLLHG